MLQANTTIYGSDQEGLVWGFLFSSNQPAQPITLDAAVKLLPSLMANPGNRFLWLHFSLSNSTSVSWMRENLSLPDAFYESLGSKVGVTRLEQDEDSLVAVINDILFDFKFDPAAVATASLCIEPHLLVSARLHPLRTMDQLRTDVRSGKMFRSPAELMARLLSDQADALANILRQTTEKVDKIEDHLLENRIPIRRSELGVLRRVVVRLQRLLAPEPAAFFRLLNRPPKWITGEGIVELQQAAEEFSAAVNDSAALVERIKLLQEELAALVNEQSNRTLFVLTVVTVLALPINIVAGLFGMNVGGIPLAEHNHGFMQIVGVLLTVTALLAYLTLGKNRNKE